MEEKLTKINRKGENEERVRQETENKEDTNTVLPENNNNGNKGDSKQIEVNKRDKEPGNSENQANRKITPKENNKYKRRIGDDEEWAN